MKTPEQLKGTIRSMATKKNLRAQEVLQMFLFERILDRLANSDYQKNFILKGGLLISSMIGIGERTTMDMDTTVRGIQMEEDDIVRIIKEILTVDVGDGIRFEYESIEPIREEDAYNNFRVHLRAKYGKIDAPMKIDVTTGDMITPAAVQYDFPMLFEDKTVPVMAYKSQGSEYRSVIINLQCAHYVMLTRPLVYTAITRGKENVIIVGERRALCMAIKKTDTEKRGTCLAKRLQAAMQ